MRLTIALLSSLLLVGACSDPPAPSAEPTTAAPAVSTPTPAAAPEERPVVPDVGEPLRRTTQLDERDTELLDAFVAFARGGGRPPAVTDRVLFFLGGGSAGSMPGDRVAERRSWRTCPPEGFYAAGSCPFDFLQVLVSTAVNGFSLAYTPAPRDGVCIVESARKDLSSVQHLRRAVVSLGTRFSSCASDFVMEVYYDGDRIAAVNLALSEP